MDLKQLQYFVVCAQTGSFSDAAKNLYSTQPSVSKVIKGLEDTLGMQLFERLPRGIRLTVQGHKMYEYASKIINEVNVLENMASSGMTKWIRISLNPSSWFANQFVDFYNETYEKKYHFQVTTAGVQSVMEEYGIIWMTLVLYISSVSRRKISCMNCQKTKCISNLSMKQM